MIPPGFRPPAPRHPGAPPLLRAPQPMLGSTNPPGGRAFPMLRPPPPDPHKETSAAE